MSIDVSSYTQKMRQADGRSREAMDKINESHRDEIAQREDLTANKIKNLKKTYNEERNTDSQDFSERVDVSNKSFKERYDALKNNLLDQMRDMARKNEEERVKVRENHERELTSITKSYDEVVQMKNREIEELKEGHETQLRHVQTRNDKRVATLVDDFTERMDESQKRQREEIARFQKLNQS